MNLRARIAIGLAHAYKLSRPLKDYHVVVVHYGLEISFVAVVTPDRLSADPDCYIRGLGPCKIIKTFYMRPVDG